MEGPSNEQVEPPKKSSPFDNMSRDELVTKCKGLLGIAQKAKKAKDECFEENKKLRDELSNYETQKSADKECLKAMQEVVESLTENKLKAATEIDSLKKTIHILEIEIKDFDKFKGEFDRISIENEAFKRQLGRLTQENENLLQDLAKYDEIDQNQGNDERIKELEQEIERLKVSFKEKEAQISQKYKENGDKEKIEELQKEIEVLKTTFKEKNDEFRQEMEKISQDFKNKEANLTVKEENRRTQELEKEIMDLKTVFMEKETEIDKLNEQLKKNDENSKKNVVNETEIQELEVLKKENAEIKENYAGREEKLIRKLKLYKNKVQEISAKLMLLKADRQVLLKTVKDYAETVPKWQKELRSASDILFKKIGIYEKENKAFQNKLSSSENELERLRDTNDGLNNDLMALKSADCSKGLQEENRKLSQDILKLKNELDAKNDLNSRFENLKLENGELLSELKEINEILKERGGVISLQLSKISELEMKLSEKATINVDEAEDLKKKVETLQNKLDEKEAELQELTKNSNLNIIDNQSEVLSTSTISKFDESMRMREIEDSFEEKYNKLRALAVKLKRKVADQTIIIQKIENKNLQSLQNEYDKLLDELESCKQKITKLENSSDADKSELLVKEYQDQIQSMKKEKEAFNLAKIEIENENVKLKNSLKGKEKELNDEIEAQKTLKAELDKNKMAVKKANVLNLEMEAYEKSLNEINKKLELKKVQVIELEGTVEAHEGTIKSLRNQIQLLEENLESENAHAKEMKHQMDKQQNKLRESEHEKSEINIKLDHLKRDHERIKLEIDSNRMELAESVSEKEKVCGDLVADKTKLLKQIYNLDDELANLRTVIKDKEQEVEDVKTEFASYKIRAQSVLRQNQSKDSGREKELEDEINTLQKTIDSKEAKISSAFHQINDLTKNFEEIKDDKTRIQNRYKELLDLLDESRLQNDSLLEDNRKANLEHQEALKTQRLQSETLINCYKKQIEDMEEKYTGEIDKIQKKLNETNNNESVRVINHQISDEQKINLIMMEREEGEGSESTTSQNNYPVRRKISVNSQKSVRRDLIPLDELLNSSFDDTPAYDVDDRPSSVSPTIELQQTKEKLGKQESRVKHLSALLAEAEQDLAKLTQLNEVLKEEVRRQQRSIEREKHVHNSEYLKNVIFKFLTLNSGDEKTHLVPVLNTILKLSPDETNKLLSVAKGGDSSGRGWSGYLPIWSSNN